MKKTGLLLVALLTLTQSAYAMLPLRKTILLLPSFTDPSAKERQTLNW